MTSPRKTRALEILADAGERGRADIAFVSRFTPELLDLVKEKLATVEREVKQVRGRPLSIPRIRITGKGRKLIEPSVATNSWTATA